MSESPSTESSRPCVFQAIALAGTCCIASTADIWQLGKSFIKDVKENPAAFVLRVVAAAVLPLFVAIGFICHRSCMRNEKNLTKEQIQKYQLEDLRFGLAFLASIVVAPLFALLLPGLTVLSTVVALGALVFAGYKIVTYEKQLILGPTPPASPVQRT